VNGWDWKLVKTADQKERVKERKMDEKKSL
jgi:hypothetical protein